MHVNKTLEYVVVDFNVMVLKEIDSWDKVKLT